MSQNNWPTQNNEPTACIFTPAPPIICNVAGAGRTSVALKISNTAEEVSLWRQALLLSICRTLDKFHQRLELCLLLLEMGTMVAPTSKDVVGIKLSNPNPCR